MAKQTHFLVLKGDGCISHLASISKILQTESNSCLSKLHFVIFHGGCSNFI